MQMRVCVCYMLHNSFTFANTHTVLQSVSLFVRSRFDFDQPLPIHLDYYIVIYNNLILDCSTIVNR
jgi:hypothetical protein